MTETEVIGFQNLSFEISIESIILFSGRKNSWVIGATQIGQKGQKQLRILWTSNSVFPQVRDAHFKCQRLMHIIFVSTSETLLFYSVLEDQ